MPFLFFPVPVGSPAVRATALVGTNAVLVSDIVGDALKELNIVAADMDPSAPEASYTLGKLNRLFDTWNAVREAVYAASLATVTLTPRLSPHTIGPSSATFSLPLRPQTIDGANLLVSGVRYPPIQIHDDPAWWQGVSLPGLSTAIPTDLYYEPAWPNGKLYFWPVPASAVQVELLTRVALGQVVLTDTFWLPPGYRDAVTLTLATMIARRFGRAELVPELKMEAGAARAVIFGANDHVPGISTRESGMPRGSGPSGTYLTGWTR